MNLVICDDDALFIQALEEELNTIVQSDSANLRIFSFTSGSELFYWYIQSGNDIDLLFIDIEMPGFDGIEVIRSLRKSKCNCHIVIISAYKDYVFDSLDYGITNYLVKPLDYRKVETVTSNAIEKIIADRKTIEISDGPEHFVLPVSNIIFIESDLIKLTFHTTDGTYQTKGRIRNYQALLEPYNFLRTHKSFLVNMSFIIGYKRCKFKLYGGYQVEISHTNRTVIIGKYNAFLRQHQIY